jgi:hypothetical protein
MDRKEYLKSRIMEELRIQAEKFKGKGFREKSISYNELIIKINIGDDDRELNALNEAVNELLADGVIFEPVAGLVCLL